MCLDRNHDKCHRKSSVGLFNKKSLVFVALSALELPV